MRDCPSCNHDYPFRRVIVKEYNKTSLINAGIETPKLSLCQCPNCEMMFVDGGVIAHAGDVDQAWFDWYYLNHYKTDDKPYSDARLESLAACMNVAINPNIDIPSVLDIGGMDGELAVRLENRGMEVFPSGVGDNPTTIYDAVVLSHTLEHIYDVPTMFQRIRSALVTGGLLFIEVPVWLDYSNLEYDNHWQHTNKFRPSDSEHILQEEGFEVIFSKQIEDYREYHVWRIIGRMK